MILADTPDNTRKHMATYSSSRALQTAELTLADVAVAVQLASWPARRRQETELALRTIGRALDRPLERIPVDPRHLSAHLKEVAPRAIGISPRRWNNVRSMTRAALGLVRPMAPGRNTNQLTPSLGRPLGPVGIQAGEDLIVAICAVLFRRRDRARRCHRGNLPTVSGPSRQFFG